MFRVSFWFFFRGGADGNFGTLVLLFFRKIAILTPVFCHYAFQSSQMAFFDPIFAIFSKNSNFDLCILPFAVKSAVYLFRTIPVPFAVNQNHLPRGCTPECAGMRVGVEGAAKSLHLPRLHALQVTPAGVSVEGDFVLGWPDVHCHPNLNSVSFPDLG